jgi:ubiquinone biosynthesis protein UbiJ
MKPKACVVVASEMTVRAFLGPQLRAMQDHYDVTLVVNSPASDLLRDLGVAGRVKRVALARAISVPGDIWALLKLVRLMRRERFDLMHSMTPKAGLLAMVAAQLSQVPVRSIPSPARSGPLEPDSPERFSNSPIGSSCGAPRTRWPTARRNGNS